MDRHFSNAQKVAEYLAAREEVESVNYAGLPTSRWYERATKYGRGKGYGSVLAFVIKGGREAGQKFVEGLEQHSHVATIGDVAATHALIKRFDEIWQASAPAVSASRTGL